MRESWGIAMTTLSWCMIPLAILWVGVAWFIGGENKRVIRQLEKEKQDATKKEVNHESDKSSNNMKYR